ncbi:MAG: hypothetical protein Ta2F_12930 [Termitinemataceae bacterium]|nr:MAG: hypothetical protein Ta2F_12930 [Termitinemataceae bacterium]
MGSSNGSLETSSNQVSFTEYYDDVKREKTGEWYWLASPFSGRLPPSVVWAALLIPPASVRVQWEVASPVPVTFYFY